MAETDKKPKVTTKDNKKKTMKTKNPFVRFSSEKREEVKKANPDMAQTQITKKLAEMWKALSKEEQEKYRPAKRTPPVRKSEKN